MASVKSGDDQSPRLARELDIGRTDDFFKSADIGLENENVNDRHQCYLASKQSAHL